MSIRHVSVRGRVQGVGYRAFVEDTALRLGLEGWVRNRRDGRVEAVFSGAEETIAAAVEACRNGPRGAHVEAIDAEEGAGGLMSLRRPGERFSVLPTA
jgi:acylphosphatase